MFEFTFFHLFFIASEILVFLVLLHMLYQRRTPESLTVWLLVLFLLPFIGVLFYLLVGTRKISSRWDKVNIELNPILEVFPEHKINNLLRHNNIAGVTDCNSFRLIPDSVDAYNEVIDALSKAKKSTQKVLGKKQEKSKCFYCAFEKQKKSFANRCFF